MVGQDLCFDLAGDVGVIAQVLLGIFPALPDSIALEPEPGARLFDHVALGAEIDQVAFVADPFAVEDVELDLAERRRHLVLDHLHARPVPDHLLAVLERAHAPDVEPAAGVEFQRVAARGRLGVTEHDPDLHPDLVDEDHQGVRLGDGAGQLA